MGWDAGGKRAWARARKEDGGRRGERMSGGKECGEDEGRQGDAELGGRRRGAGRK